MSYQRELSTGDLLDADELPRFGGTAQRAEPTRVLDLIRLQVRENPDRIAIEFGDRSITYAELDQKTDGLARLLQSKGVGPERLVCFLAGSSWQSLVSILGILKSGGACAPLDPQLPASRSEAILAETEAIVLSTSVEHLTLCSPPHVMQLAEVLKRYLPR